MCHKWVFWMIAIVTMVGVAIFLYGAIGMINENYKKLKGKQKT